jgi:hypothetical protein
MTDSQVGPDIDAVSAWGAIVFAGRDISATDENPTKTCPS